MLRRLRVVVVLGLVAAACARVPTSGSVHIGRSLPGVAGLDSRDIKAIPSGPLSGESPTGIVTGYLDALIDSDSNFATARSFFAPDTSWTSTAGITLYDANSEVVSRVSTNRVDVSITRVAVVSPRGRYRLLPGALDVPFRLIRRQGEWRIARLRSGVLLSTSDADRTLQPAELFYLNAAQNRLVPVPVLVQPDQPGIATTLIEALLAGPGRGESAAILTAAPRGVDLLGNVPIGSDGVAEVNLSGAVGEVSATELQRLSAQLVWTLRQVPTVTGVRLLENGTPLTDVGVPALQGIDAWRQYDPELPPLSSGVVASKDGAVIGVGRSAPDEFARQPISDPIVSADGTTVAGLQPQRNRTALVVGSTGGKARPRLTGGQLAAPTFDPTGDVFVVSGSGAQSKIVEVPRHGSTRSVSVRAALRDQGISDVAISRDGSRIALVVGPLGHGELVVGALSMGRREPRISGTQVVLAASRDVEGVAWSAANELVATISTGQGQRGVVRSAVDGYRPHVLTSLGLPSAPTQVAAAPDQPILAGAAGSIWSLSSGRWQRVSPGRDPSYAG